MDKTSTIQMIFEEWAANFRNKNKRKESIRPNFEELFQKWQDAGVERDDVFETYLSKAIKVHLPSRNVIEESYKRFGYLQKKTEKGFADDWNKYIKDIATETFFEYFPIEIEANKKVYGSLGKAEYDNQRRLSSQFKYLDTTELEKRLDEQNFELDLEDLKKALLSGDQHE